MLVHVLAVVAAGLTTQCAATGLSWNVELCVPDCADLIGKVHANLDNNVSEGPNAITDLRETKWGQSPATGFVPFEPSIIMSRHLGTNENGEEGVEVFAIVRGETASDFPTELHPMNSETWVSHVVLYEGDTPLAVATAVPDRTEDTDPVKNIAKVRFTVHGLGREKDKKHAVLRLETRSNKHGLIKGIPSEVPANAIVPFVRMELEEGKFHEFKGIVGEHTPVLREVEGGNADYARMEISVGADPRLHSTYVDSDNYVTYVIVMIEDSMTPAFFNDVATPELGHDRPTRLPKFQFGVPRRAVPKMRPYIVTTRYGMWQGDVVEDKADGNGYASAGSIKGGGPDHSGGEHHHGEL